MLKETTNSAFKIGDTVMISATKQTGTIIAYEGGRWKVQVLGTVMLKEASELQRREILLG
jgi:hypothetical protein